MGAEEVQPSSFDARFILKLFVTGTTPLSARAIVNTRRICEEHLKDRYDLEVIDISRHPERAKAEAIVAAPVLVKSAPSPLRKFIGDMSQVDKILKGLSIAAADSLT